MKRMVSVARSEASICKTHLYEKIASEIRKKVWKAIRDPIRAQVFNNVNSPLYEQVIYDGVVIDYYNHPSKH